jgi:hypothetical protein
MNATFGDASSHPSTRARILAAIVVGAVSAIAVSFVHHRVPGLRTDFDQTWFAAKALLEGRDPYPLIGPTGEFWYGWKMFYPLSAPVSVLALGLLPLLWARVVFSAVSGALLAYLVTREGWYRLCLFLAPAYLLHLVWLQWSVLLVCALFVPWFGWFGAVKPNVGIPYAVGQKSWTDAIRYAAMAAVPLVISFILQPTWLASWIAILREWPGGTPTVLLPGGFLLLLAATRWRRWEGRLFLLLICIPQTPGPMSALPLLLIPKTLQGMLLLAILGFGSRGSVPFILPADETFLSNLRAIGLWTMVTCYFPALYYLMRLPGRNAPNVPSASHLDTPGPSGPRVNNTATSSA